MQGEWSRTSRRRLLGTAAAAVPALALGETAATSAAAYQGVTGAARRAEAPAWTFILYELQDPYEDAIQVPQTPPPGTRYVGAEVEIDNSSDQALSFTPAEIRLRDGSGLEFRGGSAIGMEPSINPRNLNAGERSRGWVWFTVGAAAELVTLVYVGPQPQFRIELGTDLTQ